MFVNISRNQLLINNGRYKKKVVKPGKPAKRCNHCGGLVRMSCDIEACIMCSREAGHSCQTCSHVPASQVSDDKKKSA